MQIREAQKGDLSALLALYTQFKNTELPDIDERINGIWDEILEDDNHYIIVATKNGAIVSSCVLIIIPNLTHAQRPYALIENVITDAAYRNKGYASAVLNYAKSIAEKARCYKIMLQTGSRLESTLRFYERAGFNCVDKTGFVQWLD